ncbi:MAG: L-aspartate oxidase, partial [Actinomycetota bacterium]
AMTVGLLRADAVIVGGGLAGLWAGLHLPPDWEVLVVDKGTGPDAGSSPWAQGGMAVAVGTEDSPQLHASDTIRAGAGACRAQAVAVLVSEAPEALRALVALGCRFDTSRDGSLDLNREGGQSVARSVHATDATGREIMRVVAAEAQRRARRIVGAATRVLRDHGRCVGVRVATQQGELDVLGRATMLAVGGCGALYEATTNPPSATGDGIALAWDAGAEVADCEFVQFHPTALAVGGLRRVLLTEALRGEGAVVVDASGKRFLLDVHPDGELGPRDVVARAIAERGEAYLDARPIGADRVRARFPNITAAVAELGLDLATEPVPIAPAAHYFLGGVATDVDGRTSLPGLFAAGECAATGVHGANRMAGNSLTEAVVFGRRAAIAMAESEGSTDASAVPDEEGAEPSAVRTIRDDDWDRLRSAMSAGAGLARTKDSLGQATQIAHDIARNATEPVRAAAVAAGLICRSALERDESRGVHFRADMPASASAWEARHVTLRPE